MKSAEWGKRAFVRSSASSSTWAGSFLHPPQLGPHRHMSANRLRRLGPVVGCLVARIAKGVDLLAVQQAVGFQHIVDVDRRIPHGMQALSSAYIPMCAFMPKYRWFPFLAWCISGDSHRDGGCRR